MQKTYVYHAPFGDVTLIFEHNQLLTIHLSNKKAIRHNALPGQWQRQFDDYFSGKLKDFNCPISTKETPFQQQVWQAITSIPASEVRTYQQIAQLIGSHPRAVGGACAKNPLPLIMPCYRVIAKNGLGGYSSEHDQALHIKRWLLQHEGIII